MERYTRDVTTQMPRASACLDDATIVAFLDGELTGDERAEVDAHVDRCPSCLALVVAVGRGQTVDLPEGPERYAIRGEVGTGGMGQVFEAFDTVLRRVVALKCVRSGPEDRAAAQRFEREMELTARLQHPSIIPVYDAGLFPDGARYFAMRLVEGRTLELALAEATTFEARMELIPRIRRGCEAVAYAHEQAVIHRDLKPANVLLGPFGETVVLDWGLAKHVGDDDAMTHPGAVGWSQPGDDDTMTHPGAVMGTKGYMAPEVARGEPADPRSDVFSLGRVLARLSEGVEGGREVMADLQAIVERATAPDPGDRYPDAGALCHDLRRFEAGQTVSARDYSLRSRALRFVRRSRVSARVTLPLAALGLVGVVALGGVATWQLGLRRSRQACASGAAAMSGWWLEHARDDVERALTSGDPRLSVWPDVAPVLDAYARDLGDVYAGACIAARVDRSLSSAQWDATRVCLEDRERLLHATVDVWRDADLDDDVRSRAVETVHQLPAVRACEDSAQVLARYGGMAEVAEGPTAAAVLSLLARASALDAVGRYAESLEQAQRAERVSKVGEPAGLEAAVAFRRGVAMSRLDRPEAVTVLERAFGLADAAQQEWLADEALLMLASEQTHRGEYERADVWGRLAQMRTDPERDHARVSAVRRVRADLLARSGEPGEAEKLLRTALADDEAHGGTDRAERAQLLHSLAAALHDLDRLAESEAVLERALTIYAEVWGVSNPHYAKVLANLATTRGDLGDREGARALLEQAREILEVAHGARSAPVASVLNNLAKLADDGETALALYEQALSITREALGPEHPFVVEALLNVGVERLNAGDLDLAERDLRRAEALATRVLAADDEFRGHILYNLGSIAFYRGDVDEAIALYREALPYFAEAELWRAMAECNLGVILGRSERWAEAMPYLERALETRAAALPPGHEDVVHTRASLAEARLALADPEAARELAELAIADAEAANLPADLLVEARFVLARVLWTTAPDEGVAVARRARADVDAGRRAAGDRIDAWLSAHDDEAAKSR